MFAKINHVEFFLSDPDYTFLAVRQGD